MKNTDIVNCLIKQRHRLRRQGREPTRIVLGEQQFKALQRWANEYSVYSHYEAPDEARVLGLPVEVISNPIICVATGGGQSQETASERVYGNSHRGKYRAWYHGPGGREGK